MSGTLVIETLVAVILLIIFVITGPVFEKIHFHYQHESGVVMLLGIAVTLLLNEFSPEVSFDLFLA